MTEFPHVPEHYRWACDEFVEAWREVSRNPNYKPSATDRAQIIRQAQELYEVTREAHGFILWAVPEHIRRLEKSGKGPIRYVSGPKAVRWLWEEFQRLSVDPWESQATKEFFDNA